MNRRTNNRTRSKRARQLSRREFIAGTTAAGLVITLPPWLAGCGSDDDATRLSTPTSTPAPTATPVPQRPREESTLHFDFSHVALDDLQIHAIGSRHHRALLKSHDTASRAQFRSGNPLLASLRDANLTHYLEDVDLPSDALQLVWVTGTLPATGEQALAGMNIHVPLNVSQTMARTAAARGRSLRRTAKMRYYGLGAGDDPVLLSELLPVIADLVSPIDAAVALIFQQPEITNLNLSEGSSILELIHTLPCEVGDDECEPFLSTLATHIAEHWPATESGMTRFGGEDVEAWARLVQVDDPEGNPLIDMGKRVFTFDPTAETLGIAGTVARRVRNLIFDDGQYAGFQWHPTKGLSARDETNNSVSLGGGAGTEVRVVGEHGQGTTFQGIEFTRIAIVDQAKRSVEVELRNHFLRYVSSYVQFANEAGDLPLVERQEHDTQRAHFVRNLNANYTVFGVPLIGNDVALQKLNFDVPSNATQARIYFGSLGLGGDAFCPEAVWGSVSTLTFNIGIPALFLAAGVAVGAGLQQSITGFLASPRGGTALASLILRAVALAGPAVANGIFGSANSGNATPILVSLGSALLSIVTSSADEFAALLIEVGLTLLIGEAAMGAAGPVGIALKAAAVVANAATIAQSVAEVLSGPALFTNMLSFEMTTRLTISKDPDNATFPALARKYEVTLIYDEASKTAHKFTGTIEAGRSEPIEIVFNGAPSGGKVTVDVVLESDTDWIAGRSVGADGKVGPYGPIDNKPETAGHIQLAIKEQLIPLTQVTQYHHERKVTYQGGKRVWTLDANPPTATRAVLCQGQDDRLCALLGITIGQRTGNLGYAYQAGRQAANFCGESVGGVMFMLQNLSDTTDPHKSFKQLPCGFRQPAAIAYDRLGPADGRGRNFFTQPGPHGLLLQSIVLDDTTPIDLSQVLTWGRFSTPLDALAVHPMGFVVGVNRSTHKMEILQLPKMPVNADDAPNAIPFATQKSGEGLRDGLMKAPVGVAVHDGAIYVLESGNMRVQAFDVAGNPVSLFRNRTAASFALAQSGTATYLDIGVDGVGYVYVLSHLGSGAVASDYRLEIYTPQGSFLNRTTGFAAARFAVDTFRSVFALNYETMMGAPRVEPSVSHWIPSTPMG